MAELAREFVFTDKDFDLIKDLVREHTGIMLSDAKRTMVYSRLAKRLRAVRSPDFKSYIKMVLESDGEGEYVNFVNAITTNLTSFFREKHHFDYLARTLIPFWMESRQSEKRIRIWSAGCSTGEEPYSIAMTLLDNFPQISQWDIKILATDLDTNVVAKASNGVYTDDRIEGLDSKSIKKWFRRGKGEQQGMVRVSPQLQDLITFKQLNLLDAWPFKGGFDIIFCRNVVIYFNKDTQKILADRYANVLKEDGTLFLGHSESLFKVSDRFKLIGNTVYNRIV